MVAGTTLLEIAQLFAEDTRIQILFTVPSAEDQWHGVREFVGCSEGIVLPWHQVLRMRFDLALAASYRGIREINAPVMLLSHGMGVIGQKNGPIEGLNPHATHRLSRNLLVNNGRVIPTALMLTHDDEMAVLSNSCPEAIPSAVVAGDFIFDQIVASLGLRGMLREAFQVNERQLLIMTSSTWSAYSLLGSNPGIFSRFATELDASLYRVAAALHPNVWAVHGAWQIKGWLRRYLDAGHMLLRPEQGWQAALVAADVVVGDHGSVTQYAAALGKPVIMTDGSTADERPGSVAELVGAHSARLHQDSVLPELIQKAINLPRPTALDRLEALATSRPGAAAAIIRTTAYELLNLPEPPDAAMPPPVPAPKLAHGSS